MEKQIQGFRANFTAARKRVSNTCDLIVAEEVELCFKRVVIIMW